MNIVVFTAAIGDTDTVRSPLVIDPAVTYLCFSDRPCVAPYEWIPVRTTERPHLAARRIKILAQHERLHEADLTLWHDAAYQLRRNLRWLRLGLRGADAIAMRHPRRTRIEDEAIVVARYGYLPLDHARAHVARYRAEGFSDNVVTATGLLGRRVSPSVQVFNETWWDEVQRWNGRDQTSVDYAAWRAGIRLLPMPGAVKANRYAYWRTQPEGAVA